MPRGIYDRTKTKEQREVDKTKPVKKASKIASAPKRKYTKRTVVSDPTEASFEKMESSLGTAKTFMGMDSSGLGKFPDAVFFQMTEARQNLSVLAHIGDKFGNLPIVKEEIEAHLSILGQLREQYFTSGGTPEEVSEVNQEEVAPPNGTTPVHQVSVPLPPSAPVILPTY